MSDQYQQGGYTPDPYQQQQQQYQQQYQQQQPYQQPYDQQQQQQPYPQQPQQAAYAQPPMQQQVPAAQAHAPQPNYQQGDFYFHQAHAKATGEGIQAQDSLSSNEFVLELGGQRVSGVFSVTGLSSYALKLEGGKPIGLEYPPLLVTKMVQQDASLPFNEWTRETVAARGTRLPTRDLSIVAMDEGVETRRWVYRNCWISNIQFSDFDTGLDFLIEEKVTIQHGGVEEVWPQ